MNRPAEELPLVQDSLGDELGGQKIRYGLPEQEVAKVCKQMYKNDLVKITLQVAEPQAQQLITDVRMTFADTIGIVGKEGN